MWDKPLRTVKCPHSDCRNYANTPDEMPCSGCTCNHLREIRFGEFLYRHRDDPEHRIQIVKERNSDDGT